MSKDPNNEQVCMDGPFTVELKVGVTDGKPDGLSGTVTYSMPPGRIATAEDYAVAMRKCLEGVNKTNPGMRLNTRAEFIEDALGLPTKVAIPGPQDWTPKQYKAWGVTEKPKANIDDLENG